MRNREITLKTPLKLWEAVAVAAAFFAAMLLGVIISSEVFTIAQVSNVSMQDTLVAGDKLYINKTAYWNNEPKRGDIVVFLKEESLGGFFNKLRITSEDLFLRFKVDVRSNRLIKRVIGLPGDIIELKNGDVYINYIKLNEEYIKGTTLPYGNKGKIVVPEDTVFVMGDNRLNSDDSRLFGFVNMDSIEGRAVFRYWPFKEATSFKHSYY